MKSGTYLPLFAEGSLVRIADRPALEAFRRSWHYHNPIQAEQLEFANTVRRIMNVYYYHGGDELYVLDSVPGIWHPDCLRPLS